MVPATMHDCLISTKLAISCSILLLCLSACSDGSTTTQSAAAGGQAGSSGGGGGAGGNANGGAAGATPVGGASNGDDCDIDGVRFGMVGAFSHTSRDAQLYVWDGEVPGILGIVGSADGKSFMFMRAGDASDGNLGEVMTYDASQYPHEMKYTQLDDPTQAETCDPGPGACSGFFAFAGSFTVSQVTPTYEATFSLTMLSEGGGEAPGDPIGGAVTGCIAVPNP
jgi:hypothetical protein